jgi:hypothetical protein
MSASRGAQVDRECVLSGLSKEALGWSCPALQ